MRETVLFFFVQILTFEQTISQSMSSNNVNVSTNLVTERQRGTWINVAGKKVNDINYFKGISDQIELFSIFEISFQENKTDSLSLVDNDSSRLFVLSGLIGNRKIIIADINRDRDFSNDLSYKYSVLKTLRKQSVDSAEILTIPYWYERDGKRESRYIDMRILPFEPQRFSAVSVSELMDVYFSLYVNRKTNLSIEGSEFEVGLRSPYDYDAGYENSIIEIKNIETNEIVLNDPPISVGETINLAGHHVVFDRVSFYGDSIHVRIDSKKIVEGVRVMNRLPKALSADIRKFTSRNAVKRKYILLDFWGSWCIPCIKSIPNLRKIYLDFNETNKLEMISVAYERHLGDTTKTKRLIFEKKMEWQHIYEFRDENMLNRSLVNEFRVTSFPTTILIDENMNIVSREIGAEGIEALHGVLRKLLRQN